jgi:two-component system sensor histidine kinase PilS (NtrC family)
MSLQERLATVGQLAAGIAHEIRNPLASLSGSIQLLKSESQLSPQSDKLMRIVLRETDRLDHLASSFLTYAKPSELSLEEVNLAKVFEEVVALVKNSKDFNHHKVQLGIQVDPSLQCKCDPRQLRQILWNLILNAIQAISTHGEVMISAFQDDEKIKISVKDSGEGISEEVKKRVFDPFYTTKAGGSGLGLALVYQMVKNHGGTLGVESRVGEGSLFWFELFREGPKSSSSEELSVSVA